MHKIEKQYFAKHFAAIISLNKKKLEEVMSASWHLECFFWGTPPS